MVERQGKLKIVTGCHTGLFLLFIAPCGGNFFYPDPGRKSLCRERWT